MELTKDTASLIRLNLLDKKKIRHIFLFSTFKLYLEPFLNFDYKNLSEQRINKFVAYLFYGGGWCQHSCEAWAACLEVGPQWQVPAWVRREGSSRERSARVSGTPDPGPVCHLAGTPGRGECSSGTSHTRAVSVRMLSRIVTLQNS